MAMPDNNSIPGFDRVNDVFRSLDDQFGDIRGRLEKGRDRVEREVRKRTEQVQKELEKVPLYQRAQKVRQEVESELEKRREQLLSAIGIASRDEIQRIDKKLSTIQKKLNQLVKEASVDL